MSLNEAAPEPSGGAADATLRLDPSRGRIARLIALPRQADLVEALVPPRHWYKTALWMGRLHGSLSAVLPGRRRAVQEALLRDHWLAELTRRGSFHVPWRCVGAEALESQPEDEQHGVVYCGLHVPLFGVATRAWLELGFAPDAVIADEGTITNGQYLTTGMRPGLPAFAAGAGALLRARTILRRGGRVGSLLDRDLGRPVSTALLELAGQVGSRTVLFWADLETNGVVRVTFQHAPVTVARTAAEIEQNLRALAQQRLRIFSDLGLRPGEFI